MEHGGGVVSDGGVIRLRFVIVLVLVLLLVIDSY
jgi:hypothetical protein